MMRETFWKRLEALEEIPKLRNAPVEIRHISFIHPDGSEVEATIASGPGGFVCHREPDETLDGFKSRAHSECPPAKPHLPPPILIFTTEGPSDAPHPP
jgi:hypothetical protein